MSASQNSKSDGHFTDKDEKQWKKMIVTDNAKFLDSNMITSESYNTKNVFVNPYDLTAEYKTFKEECIASKQFTEKQFNFILKKAKSIHQTNEVKAVCGAGFYADIKKGDALSIEHVIAILLYIHFPAYVAMYRSSEPSKFYHFHRFLYEIVHFFGQKMPKEMVVFVGLSGGLNNEEKDDENMNKRKNDEWEFLNTAFLVSPFSACKQSNIFSKGTLVLSLKTQFLNEFNDTNYFDLAAFSSFADKDGKNEILFFGKFAELSIVDIRVAGDDKCDFSEYFRALNYWQKLTSGFADFNAKKYNIEPITDETQLALLNMLNGSDKVPKYIQRVFKFYNDSKKGQEFHRMYTELLDCGFDKICKNKRVTKEIAKMLFNDDMSDVDPNKIKKIFKNAQRYVNTKEKKMVFL